MLRRLQVLVLATILIVAAFSTGYRLPVLPALPGDPGRRRLVRPRPARPVRPRGGLRGQPAPRPRRRPAAGDLHAAQQRAACPSRGSRSTTRRRCPGGLPGRAHHPRRQQRAVVAHPRAADPARPLPDRAAAHPDRRPVRLLRGGGDRRAGHQRRRLPAPRAAADVAAAGRRASRAATRRPSGPSRRRPWPRPSARTRRATA